METSPHNADASKEASVLDTDAFMQSSASMEPPTTADASSCSQRHGAAGIVEQSAHTSLDAFMPTTGALKKTLSRDDDSVCRRGSMETSAELDIDDSSASNANCCTNAAPRTKIPKKEKPSARRKGFLVGRTQNASTQQPTFCKCCNGLFRKAHELSTLCDAEVAAIVFSPSGKLSEFASSSMSNIIKRYQSCQPQVLSNDMVQQYIERLKCEAILSDGRLKWLQEFKRCEFEVFEKKTTPISMDEIKNIEYMLEHSLEKINKRKMELFERKMQTLVKKIKKQGSI